MKTATKAIRIAIAAAAICTTAAVTAPSESAHAAKDPEPAGKAVPTFVAACNLDDYLYLRTSVTATGIRTGAITQINSMWRDETSILARGEVHPVNLGQGGAVLSSTTSRTSSIWEGGGQIQGYHATIDLTIAPTDTFTVAFQVYAGRTIYTLPVATCTNN